MCVKLFEVLEILFIFYQYKQMYLLYICTYTSLFLCISNLTYLVFMISKIKINVTTQQIKYKILRVQILFFFPQNHYSIV